MSVQYPSYEKQASRHCTRSTCSVLVCATTTLSGVLCPLLQKRQDKTSDIEERWRDVPALRALPSHIFQELRGFQEEADALKKQAPVSHKSQHYMNRIETCIRTSTLLYHVSLNPHVLTKVIDAFKKRSKEICLSACTQGC